MNKKIYNFGNHFKVKFRNHFCYGCGNRLSIIRDSKVIDKKDDNAKYYDFSIDVDGGVMAGPCEFIHNVFFCLECSKRVEFVTQISLEDIDIIVDKVEKNYKKHGKDYKIIKSFVDVNGLIVNDYYSPNIAFLCLSIEESKSIISTYKLPISRKKIWERPYYYKLKKRTLINYINKNIIK